MFSPIAPRTSLAESSSTLAFPTGASAAANSNPDTPPAVSFPATRVACNTPSSSVARASFFRNEALALAPRQNSAGSSPSLPARSFSAPPSAFSSLEYHSLSAAGPDYDSDPEPDILSPADMHQHSNNIGNTTLRTSGMYPEVGTALGYTPARSKLWADYLCNADTPFSYSSTVHHPDHFKFVPAPQKIPRIASANGAAVASAGGDSRAIATAKSMTLPVKNKRSSFTAGLDAAAAAAATSVGQVVLSPRTIVGSRRLVKRVAKRQRRVAEQSYEEMNAAALFPIAHYTTQNSVDGMAASGMEVDDDM